MQNLKTDKLTLRKFGLTMGMAFLVIALLIFLRHKYSPLPALSISLLFLTLAVASPVLLKPIYIFWMALAAILAWLNTRLILWILFYLIFTPIGLVMKLFGADLLDRKIDKFKKSYWTKKEKGDFKPENYERQF